MAPIRLRARLVITAGLLGLAAPVAAAAPVSIVYDEREAVRAITDPAGPGAPVDASRGLLRQDPGPGGIFDPLGRDALFRVAKLSTHEIVDLAPEAMADRIQDEIDDPEHGAASGLVAIDEIGNRFNDGRVRITYSTVVVRGTRIRVSSARRVVVTPRGYRLVRRPAALPSIPADGPGTRLSLAMEMLAQRHHPLGGTYADRVHLYIAPAFGTSIAAGRGPHRHLGNDGKPHRATWRGVMPALARAGGVWIEMYHSTPGAGITTMTAREWRTVPQRFGSYAARFGADLSRFHLLMTSTGAVPAGARGCGAPMECQWRLAESTPAGAAMLANGPGAYRVGSQAGEWRAQFNRVFPVI